MSNSDSTPELPDDAAQTIERIRSKPLPTDSLRRVLDRAANLDHNPVVRVHTASSSFSYARSIAGVAALVLIAISFSLVALMQKSAWSQVLEAVSKKPWMRLTLQRPDGDLPIGEHFEEVTMWLSNENQAAAFIIKSRSSWVDLETKDEYRFDLETGRIRITKLNTDDNTAIRRLTALSPFDPGMHQLAGLDLKPLHTKESETTVDGKAYRDFEFQFAPPSNTTASERLTVRVDKSTNEPVQLLSDQAKFLIDYPNQGPEDIYALGVEKSTPVSDLRSLEKYFRDRPARVPADYKAVAVRFPADKVRKWSIEAVRYQLDKGTSSAELADIEQLDELSQRVYFAGGDTPTNQMPEMNWWVTEVNKLTFEDFQMGESNYPHGLCYMPYGGIGDYRSLHVSTLKGLEGLVELRGPELSVWLEPDRDLIVRRYEHVGDDGSITVWQHDDVFQDSQGIWFTKRWRSGSVLERGDLLTETMDRKQRESGVNATVHIAEITFQ